MKLYRSVIFIFSVLALMALVCVFFPQPSLTIGGVDLHFPSVDVMLHRQPVDTATTTSADEMILAAESQLALPVDSVALAHADSLAFYDNFFAQSPVRIVCPGDDPSFLFPLFDALDNADKESLHVMHYGDSQIEGDRISGYLRTELQRRFGGSGPGLIPLSQPIPAMSVKQTLTDSVAMYYAGGMMGPRAAHKRYGAMAQMAQVNTSADTISCFVESRRGKDFQSVTLFAGHVDSLLAFSVNGVSHSFPPSEGICHAKVDLPKRSDSFTLSLSGRGDVYGINIAGSRGVSVTNIPLRGSDGTFFSRIEPVALKTMLRSINTRLVILEFGGNALPALNDSADVDKWCNYFKAQVGYMHRMVPEATILVIGPADMSVKIDGELQTHPLLPYLVSQMCSASVAEGAAFWNMFSVMGGLQSMVAWVKHKPMWAAPDYVHFTKRGADRISQVLYESLMVYYSYRSFISSDASADDE